MATAAPRHRTGQPAWHALEVDAVLDELAVDPAQGLDSGEVERRRVEHGPNRLTEATATAWWVTLLSQFRSPLIYLLLLAGLLTLALGEHLDATAIAAVLALNATIGFVQERKAEASVLALMQLVSPTAHVVRDGTDTVIESVDLVPGDVVLLESGVKIPADARLVSVSSLQVDESLLTGESVPVGKGTEAVGEHEVLGDQRASCSAAPRSPPAGPGPWWSPPGSAPSSARSPRRCARARTSSRHCRSGCAASPTSSERSSPCRPRSRSPSASRWATTPRKCSWSRQPWPWPPSPRACRWSSPSPWPEACGAWPSATPSCGASRRSRPWGPPPSSAPTRPAR